jgi:hypothetical protein
VATYCGGVKLEEELFSRDVLLGEKTAVERPAAPSMNIIRGGAVRDLSPEALDRNRLVAAATTTTAASAAAHGRHWTEASVARRITPGHSSENRDDSLGRLLAVGAVGSAGTHGLQFVELILTGWAMIFVERHTGTFLT